MARRTIRKLNYFRRAGFLPSEARELAQTSKAGFYAPYFQKMVRDRRGLFMNAIRYDWTIEEYRRAIYQRYRDRGLMEEGERWSKNNVWALLRWYSDRVPVPDEYESPWRKRVEKKRTRKGVLKRVTRRDALRSWIAELSRSIGRATTERRRQKLIQQRENLEAQLARMQ